MPVLEVALPIPLPKTFDYLMDEATQEDVGRCVAVPFGQRKEQARFGLIVRVKEHSDTPAGKLKHATRILRELPAWPQEWRELVQFAASYYHTPLGEAVASAIPSTLRHGEVSDAPDPDPLFALTDTARQHGPGKSSKKQQLWAALAHQEPQSKAMLAAHEVDVSQLTRWLREGVVHHMERSTAQRASVSSDFPAKTLTGEQAQAVAALHQAHSRFQAFLLHGITGSGKTEVYLQAMQHTLQQGQQVLLLVPEIGLTPQLEQRARQRYPQAEIASLHSGVAEVARARGYLRAMQGQADIVIGTRLAIFTPMPRLGLILVDEEHDASYKQQEGMLYSARDLAVWRARQRRLPVVLGSATPSLESEANTRQGRYQRLVLSERASGVVMPTVTLHDIQRQKLHEGLSQGLLAALQERLSRQEQSLIFLNRRGYAPILACQSCGWQAGCQHCTTRLVVHLGDQHLRCHYCGHQEIIPHACPHCGDPDLQPYGRGTQRVEEALQRQFPEARILRLDRDSANSPRQWQALLSQIRAGDADILVGTQMMAKGHDFPRLTLVGVLSADNSLYAADFRATERLFQQLMQVGGRAGRGEIPGEVFIQTEHPQHPLYQCLQRHDYTRYADMLLFERQQAGFPPSGCQALLRADSLQLEQTLEFLRLARQLAQNALLEQPPHGFIHIHDPVPMRLSRLATRERGQLLIDSDNRQVLQGFLQSWLKALWTVRKHRDLRWQIDVDPLEI